MALKRTGGQLCIPDDNIRKICPYTSVLVMSRLSLEQFNRNKYQLFLFSASVHIVVPLSNQILTLTQDTDDFRPVFRQDIHSIN